MALRVALYGVESAALLPRAIDAAANEDWGPFVALAAANCARMPARPCSTASIRPSRRVKRAALALFARYSRAELAALSKLRAEIGDG